MSEGTQQASDAAATADDVKPTRLQLIVKWAGWLALLGSVATVIYALGGLTLARYDLIEKITGFFAFVTAFTPALVLTGFALIVLVLAFVLKSKPRWPAILSLVLSGGLALTFYTQVMVPGGSVPPIHDITTDLDDPPQFTTLDRLPVSTGMDFATGEPIPLEVWRDHHEEAYSHIQPIVIAKAPAEVIAEARALMERNGWEIAAYDEEAGHVEGTAYAGYLKFRDDVVVEVTPVADGSTRVDMRSVSQVGQSDLGYNAARIEAFLEELRAAQ